MSAAMHVDSDAVRNRRVLRGHTVSNSTIGAALCSLLCATLTATLTSSVRAQNTAPASQSAPNNPTQSAPDQTSFSARAGDASLTDDQIKQLLLGKSLYLRSGYLDNTLDFDVQGRLMGQSPKGSYTLSIIQVDKVQLSKRKIELEGQRYALHFLDTPPVEDPTKVFETVRITPKKKLVKITVDRVQAEKSDNKKSKKNAQPHTSSATANGTPVVPPSSSTTGPAHTGPAQPQSTLLAALDKIFAQGIDSQMIAAMPDFWRIYYQAAAAKTDYQPQDPTVLRQTSVDQKAKLVSVLEPASNEYAQQNDIAGIALYHAVIGSDGKPLEIVAVRPIGFGLDESAVDTIRKATFQPAIKDGKPVPVWLELVVSFRIYSKRTSESSAQQATGVSPDSASPAPHSLQ